MKTKRIENLMYKRLNGVWVCMEYEELANHTIKLAKEVDTLLERNDNQFEQIIKYQAGLNKYDPKQVEMIMGIIPWKEETPVKKTLHHALRDLVTEYE